MKPPAAPDQGSMPQVRDQAPAVLLCPVVTLRKRPDFMAAAKARRAPTPGFVLQARQRRDGEAPPPLIRVGFTCSKKVGNAVARNRAKRRLRELARAVLPGHGLPGWDYVLIGRHEVTASRKMELMVADLKGALTKLHKGRA